MRWALALLLVLGACTKEPKTEAPPSNTAPAASAPAPSPDAGIDPCVADCVQKNQMRATSQEQIEADCRQQCVGPGH
jgi:hypothetical protein